MTDTKIVELVRTAVADSLGRAPHEVAPSARLISDLGVGSMDLLAVLMGVERSTGVEVQMRHLRTFLEGDIAPDDYADDDDVLKPAALAYLQSILPQLRDVPQEGLRSTDLLSILTVQNLADVVALRIGGSR